MGLFSMLARWNFPRRLKRRRLGKPFRAAALSPRRLEQRRVLDASAAGLLLSPLGDTGEFVQVGEDGSSEPPAAAFATSDAPTVLSVTSGDLLLTDADVGSNTFTLEVLFSEAMVADGSADPVLTFDPSVDSTLTFASGNWSSDATRYTATYDIADANVRVSNVDVSVFVPEMDVATQGTFASGAQNLNNQLLLLSTTADVFSIDTENPTVLDVTPSTFLITESDVGSNGFTVDVTFSEAMLTDGSADPTLTLMPSVADTLTLDASASSWLNSTTYRATYDVAGVDAAFLGVSVLVADGRDAAGNLQTPHTAAELFDIAIENRSVNVLTIDSLTITSPLNENGETELQLIFSSPNLAGPHTVEIDWGDGSGLETFALDPGTRSLATPHRYLDDNPSGTSQDEYLVTVRVLDNDNSGGRNNGVAVGNATVIVRNVAPTILSVFQDQEIKSEGDSFTVNVEFADPGTLDTHTYEVDWGDGTITTGSIVGRNFSASRVYVDDGNYTVEIRVFDDDLGVGTTTFETIVENAAPSNLQIEPLEPIDENGFAQLQLTFDDPGILDTYTVEVDWGDGTPLETFTLGSGARSFSAPHQYLDDNPTVTPQDDYTIQVRVLDDDGGEATGSVSVTTRNVAPFNFQFVAVEDIFENEFAQLQFTFEDPGTLDTHSVTIDWGDGTIETFELDLGIRSFATPHQYLDDNPTGTGQDTYTINVTVTDDDGLQGSGSTTVLVKNIPPNQLVLALTPNSENDPPPPGSGGGEGETTTLAGIPAPLSTAGSLTPIALDLLEGSDNPEEEFLAALLGSGSGISVVADSARFVGRLGDGNDPNLAQSATFSNFSLIPSDGSLPSIELDGGGIFLTSGVANIPLTNTDTSFDAGSVGVSAPDEGVASDTADLEAILDAAGQPVNVNNVNLIEFEFTVAAGTTSIEAEFVFGSDEFPDQGVTDVFVFIVDGRNFAFFSDGSLVSFVEGQNATNFNDNGDGAYGIEYDGISNVLRVVGLLDETIPEGGPHTLKIAIANTSDTVFDSGVFIGPLQAGTAQSGGIGGGGVGQPGSVVIFENDQVDLDISFFDVGTLDTFTVLVDWGDGTVDTIEDLAAGEFMAAITHRYLDDAPTGTPQDFYTITVTVIDDDLGQATGQVDVLVRNAAPTFGTESEGVVLTGTAIDRFGRTTLTGSFNDRAGADSETFTLFVDWGDGLPEAFAFNDLMPEDFDGSTPYVFTITHVYSSPVDPASPASDVRISVRLVDDDMGFDTEVLLIAGPPGEGPGSFVIDVMPQTSGLVDQLPVETARLPITFFSIGAFSQSLDIRSSVGEAKAVSDRFLVIYEIDPAGQIGEEQKLEFDVLDDLPALFRKLPDNHYKIDLIHEETDMRRPVLDVYVREGILIDPSDDTEGTRDRPPMDATLQEENRELEEPQQPDAPANDFEKSLDRIDSALQETALPLQRVRDNQTLAPVAVGLVAASSLTSWAQQVDRTVATAGSQKWRRLRWRNFPNPKKPR